MNFDIRDYIWNIFEISKEQNTDDISTAFDMFIENLNLGRDRYKGCDNLDYSKVSKSWLSMKDSARDKQIRIFNKIIESRFIRLRDAWMDDNKSLFEVLSHPSYKYIGVKTDRKSSINKNNKRLIRRVIH